MNSPTLRTTITDKCNADNEDTQARKYRPLHSGSYLQLMRCNSISTRDATHSHTHSINSLCNPETQGVNYCMF